MSARASSLLAWALAAFALALLASGFVIGGVRGEVGQSVFIWALALVFSAVGGLIASRHPGNAMGWIFLGVGVATGLGALASSYAEHWVDGGGGSRALGETAAWYGNLSWVPFILVPCTFLLLLFPDGRLPSRRWRWVAWCAGVGITGVFVTEGLGPIDDHPQVANPYGIESPLLEPLTGLASLVLVIGIAGSCASLILRFRRSNGERRHQIKWLALAGAVAGVTVPIASAGTGLWGTAATNVASMLGVLSLPLAAGIAILRHRLYDIDVVINRTLVYGALTATLGGTYLGLVLLIGLAVGESDVAIAVSTLAVAALFRPARGRIQALVDRRFYRRRYDAARTLESFGGRLRNEIDLEALGADLRGVVRDTVQPAHVSLWLKGAAVNAPRPATVRLAWALFGLWAVLAAGAAVLSAREGDLFEILLSPALGVFAGVGALVASRQPRNPIGWILIATALAFAFTVVIEAYVKTSDGPALVALWLDDWTFIVWIALACVWIPLLFPDGRLPSPRWRPFAWGGTAAFAVGLLGTAFGDRTLETAARAKVANPYALPGVAGDVAAEIASLIGVLYVLPVLGAVAALATRTRHSRGVERQQLKWFTFVGALMLAALMLSAISLLDEERLGDNVGLVGWGGFLVLFALGLPAAIGTAILRHRLYDIDVVINRTLVYGALTLTLGGAYLGLVLLIGLAVGESDVAIAGSTLAVAALFRPARARIQAAVDRRFYRRRYDAARTLEAFSARLREELDLETLRGEIGAVVGETVQPAHVSVWLREGRS